MKSLTFLKAISNNTKLRLVNLLLENELCVCEFEEILHLRQVNISKNLINLKENGVVCVRREKQRGFYSLSEDFLGNKFLVEHIRDLRFQEEILQKDYQEFIKHEEVKDENIYVCSAYRKEAS